MKKIYQFIRIMLNKTKQDHISAFASQAAYFIILSAFPFMIFLLTLLKYSPLTVDNFLHILHLLAPGLSIDFLEKILTNIYSQSNLALTSLTIIFILWSSGRGMLAISRGIHQIYHIDESRNYIHLRLIAMFYTVLLAIGLIVTLGLLVFGNIIYHKITDLLPFLKTIAALIISIRSMIIFILLTLLFFFIYKVLPNKKIKLLHILPGAVFSALGWMLTSKVVAIYFTYSTNFSYMYGGLAGIMIILLWLYFCMYELFIGAELNNYLYPEVISGNYKSEKTRNF